MFKLKDGRTELWQWDINNFITVEDKSITQVHFYRDFIDNTIVVKVVEGEVRIPDELLQKSGILEVYAITDNHTVVKESFTINMKVKPADYIYTPTEVKTWESKLDNSGWTPNKVLGTDEAGDVVPVEIKAEDVRFNDNDTFQDKFNNGSLKGEKGDKGDTGAKGADGAQGATGATGAAGKDGVNGKDATINGVNALTIEQGENITLAQEGSKLTISATATGGGGGSFPLADRMKAGTGTDGIILGTSSRAVAVDGLVNGSGTAKDGFVNGYSDKIGDYWGLHSTSMGNIASGRAANAGLIQSGNTGGTYNAGGHLALGYADRGNIYAGYNSWSCGCISAGRVSSNGTLGADKQSDGCLSMGSAYKGTIAASGKGSLAFGSVEANEVIKAQGSGCVAGGNGNVTSGQDSNSYGAFAHGTEVGALSNYQMATGKSNITDGANTYARIVGNGTTEVKANAYTLDWQGNGTYAGKVSSTGADYAEYFEWVDGNTAAADRVGYIVSLEGDKIKFANETDDVLGIISGTVGVLGDNYEWQWQGKYQTDEFGRVIYDMVEEFHTDIDKDGNEIKTSLGMFPHPRIVSTFDANKEYVNRANRPEWDAVGMMGKLFVRDDGTAQVGGYVKPVEGIATASETKTRMRVMSRVSDNVIRVCLI